LLNGKKGDKTGGLGQKGRGENLGIWAQNWSSLRLQTSLRDEPLGSISNEKINFIWE
jgi:hypothetical protein